MATLRTLVNGTKADAGDCNFNFNALNNESAVIENTVSAHTTSIGTLNSSVISLQSSVSTISSSISGGALVPIGTIVWYAKDTAPSGYLICNGSAVSRTDYADLYAKIGTAFGSGDGSTTFNLPNLTDSRFIEGGISVGTTYNAGLPNHTHSYSPHNNGGTYGAQYGTTTYTALLKDDSTNTTTGNVNSATNIYGQSNTVQPKALVLLPCIKY